MSVRQSRALSPLSLKAQEVHISTCQLDDDSDVAVMGAWDVLSSEEITRAKRFRFMRDRTRYVRGRAFLRQVLGTAIGQRPASVALAQTANGKPFLDETLHFNLSHSDGLAVLAISACGPVGIDLEFIDRRVDISGLVRSCFTKEEEESILALPLPEQATRFFTYWTAKEARMKLTGEGMLLPPRQIVLDIRDGVPVGYIRPEHPPAQAVFIALQHPAALCCLALPQGAPPSVFSFTSEQISSLAAS